MRRPPTILLAATILAVLPTGPVGAGEADPPRCDGLTATIWGGDGDDLLIGTSGDDVIAGLGGADEIRSMGGDDVVCGGPGNDLILGGNGDDLLYGGGGRDEIRAGAGHDTVYGGGHGDVLIGWSGEDTLDGGRGRDRLRGQGDADALFGGRHGDDLAGGPGNDLLDGQRQTDRCREGTMTACEITDLSEGDRGRAVRFLQRTLQQKKLYRGPIDGKYDREVAVAVAAFHKATGPAHPDPTTAVAAWKANPPSEAMTISDFDALLAFAAEPPRARPGQPDRVEVDIGRQVLYLVLDDRVDAIVHVSTGRDPDDTPRTTHMPDGGYFWYKHPYDGWSPRAGQWSIYKFWAYRTTTDYNYGVHGYLSVPYYPASHGCTRVHVWDADYLHERFWIGMPVHVWDE